jgi:hypothetical protein
MTTIPQPLPHIGTLALLIRRAINEFSAQPPCTGTTRAPGRVPLFPARRVDAAEKTRASMVLVLTRPAWMSRCGKWPDYDGGPRIDELVEGLEHWDDNSYLCQ